MLVSFRPPSFSVGPLGGIYFADGEEYQVQKFSADGTTSWALRVAHDRPPYPREMIDARLERRLALRPDRPASEYWVPERRPALTAIATDDHGHLWVFPWAPPRDPPEGSATRPVDVYDAAGTRLFSGLIGAPFEAGWARAHGDHVYTDEHDADSGEQIVVRYRLVEPFE